MVSLIIYSIAYVLGFVICFWMMRVEREAENEKITKGEMLIAVLFSILSWLMIVVLLARSWFIYIGRKGYWDKPVKEIINAEVIKSEGS